MAAPLDFVASVGLTTGAATPAEAADGIGGCCGTPAIPWEELDCETTDAKERRNLGVDEHDDKKTTAPMARACTR